MKPNNVERRADPEKKIPLKDRLAVIKDSHNRGRERNLSKAFVEKAINDALAIIDMVDDFDVTGVKYTV